VRLSTPIKGIWVGGIQLKMKFDSIIWVGWGRDIPRTRIPDKFLKILFPNALFGVICYYGKE